MDGARPDDWYAERDRLITAIEAGKGSAVHWSNLAYAQLRCGQPSDAKASARRALEIDRGWSPAWINLGAAQLAHRDLASAEASAREALALDPDEAASHLFAAHVAREGGALTQAQSALLTAVRLDPNSAEAWSVLALTWMDLGQHVQALNAIERTLAIEPGRPEFFSNRMMIGQYHAELGSQVLREMAEAYGRALPVGPMPEPPPRAGGPLRVAYLSPDLRAHPVGYILRGVLQAHDPQRVAASIWNLFPGRDWLSDEYRASGLRFHEVTGLSDAALAEALREADIDVLVDLAGHTAHNRLGVLARRPARVQVHFLGWFAALGVPGLDAVLMGADQLPEGHAAHFTEPVWALPDCHFRYRRLPHAPEPPREDPHEPLRFGSFNNTAKLTPEVLDTWADILRAVPGSVLELRWKTLGDPNIRNGLARRFASAGIEPDRLALHGACPHDELLAAYRSIHVALDPFPFSGGMTTLEALSMGVPVVTLAQHRPVSRQGHAMLHALGLEALSTTTVRDYVATAVRLATDAERRLAVRRRLVDDFETSPLADAPGLARQLEDAYDALLTRREGA